MARVNLPSQEPGVIEGRLGTIGSLVGGIFGPVGGAVGGAIGGAAAKSGKDQVGAVESSSIDRRMGKINAGDQFRQADEAAARLDPETQEQIRPFIQEALKRTEQEEAQKQSLRRDRLNGAAG